MRTFFLAGSAALVLLGSSLAVAQIKDKTEKPVGKKTEPPKSSWSPYSILQENKIIAAIDLDLDGAMTMKEIEGCVERIKELDVNGDGKLDADEYLKAPPVNKYAPGFSIVKVLDANSDKIISAEEIAGAVAAIKTLDKNKDSKLVSAEYSMASPASMGGEPGGGAGGAGGGGGRQQPSPEEFVKQNDKVGDGKVQKKELTGMIVGFFDRMDTDKDGSVTVEEVKASRERQRQQNGAGGGAGPGGGAGRGGPAPGSPAPGGPGAAPPAEKKAEAPKEETPKADAPK